jgi:hypothetical protein
MIPRPPLPIRSMAQVGALRGDSLNLLPMIIWGPLDAAGLSRSDDSMWLADDTVCQ